MDGEAAYNFQELSRHLVLANTNNEAEREEHLGKAEINVEELKRIFSDNKKIDEF